MLLIGGGGREHAIAVGLKASPRLGQLHVTHPENPGLGALGIAVDVPVDPRQLYRLDQYCNTHNIGLIVIGPEEPLAQGFADGLRRDDRPVFGPNADGARLEADKAWCKELLRAAVVPMAEGRAFSNYESAANYLRSREHPPVIKASGLAKGKGVVLPDTLQEAHKVLHEIMVDKIFGEAGSKVVLEDRMTGREVSVLAITDGKAIQLLPTAQDHKRLLDGDEGPNTGGMGAFCPSNALDDRTMARVEQEILLPTVDTLKREGIDFRGVLYAGIMLTPAGPRVLEYNVRFGDPECQVILPRLKSDLLELLLACAQRRLGEIDLQWDPRPAVCIVIASQGYPDKPVLGVPIHGISEAEAVPGVTVFYAGAKVDSFGQTVTAGGRVLAITALGDDLAHARDLAYQAAKCIDFPGMQMRTDIGIDL